MNGEEIQCLAAQKSLHFGGGGQGMLIDILGRYETIPLRQQ